MIIKNINVGKDRWYLIVQPDTSDGSYSKFFEFKKWIKETYPDIYCRYDRFTHRELEIRGSDLAIKMHIIMRWS